MASEMSPQSIREVRFREKLRGYHPEDVDAFVANVASTVEALHRRLDELASASQSGAAPTEATAEPAAASTDTSEVEESLRRTLILAQRTADMAVKEAQEEAARLVAEAEAQRASLMAEVDERRARTMAELENELSGYRERLHDERDALQRDVEALQAYVAQERERLRIYFTQQLQQVTDGVPSVSPPPTMEAPARAQPEKVVVDAPGLPEQPMEDATGADASEAAGDEAEAGEEGQAADGDDPFLAELRRAVTDNEPLGPRDEVDDLPPRDTRDFDIFNEEEGGGRFLRRRR